MNPDAIGRNSKNGTAADLQVITISHKLNEEDHQKRLTRAQMIHTSIQREKNALNTISIKDKNFIA